MSNSDRERQPTIDNFLRASPDYGWLPLEEAIGAFGLSEPKVRQLAMAGRECFQRYGLSEAEALRLSYLFFEAVRRQLTEADASDAVGRSDA